MITDAGDANSRSTLRDYPSRRPRCKEQSSQELTWTLLPARICSKTIQQRVEDCYLSQSTAGQRQCRHNKWLILFTES